MKVSKILVNPIIDELLQFISKFSSVNIFKIMPWLNGQVSI